MTVAALALLSHRSVAGRQLCPVLVLVGALVACSRGDSGASPQPQPSSRPSPLSARREAAAVAMRLQSVPEGTILEVDVDPTVDSSASARHLDLSLTEAQRPAALKRLFEDRGNVRVDIFAGREVAHAAVIALMVDLSNAGFTNIQFGIARPDATTSQ